MLVKSTCKRSNGVVSSIRCRGCFGHITLMLEAMCTGLNRLLHLIGHAWPPEMLPQWRQGTVTSLMTASRWHLFKVVTWWALGTTRSRKILGLTFGCWAQIQAPWWTLKFCWLHRISLPSLLEVCSTRSAFKSVFFCTFSQFNTAQHQVLFLGFSLISNMNLYKCMACSDTYLLFQAVVTLNYGGVMNFGLICWSQGDSIEDSFHCVQVYVSSSSA